MSRLHLPPSARWETSTISDSVHQIAQVPRRGFVLPARMLRTYGTHASACRRPETMPNSQSIRQV